MTDDAAILPSVAGAGLSPCTARLAHGLNFCLAFWHAECIEPSFAGLDSLAPLFQPDVERMLAILLVALALGEDVFSWHVPPLLSRHPSSV